MKYPLLIVALFFNLGITQAEIDFNSNCKLAYDAIFNSDYQTAEALLLKEKQDHPHNLVRPYLECFNDFLLIYWNEDQSDYHLFESKCDGLIKAIAAEEESAYKHLLTGELYLLKAVLKIKFKEMLSGAMTMVKAKNAIEECSEKYPDFLDVKLSLGLIHALAGSVPNQYKPYLKYFLGFEGTIKQGLEEVNAVIESDRYHLHTMAHFFKAYITNELTVHKEYDLEKLDLSLDGVMAQCYQAMLWVSDAKPQKAIDLLIPNLDTYNNAGIYFPYYLIGKAKLNLFQDDAAHYLQTFLDKYKGVNYLKSAHSLLATYYFVRDDAAKFYKHKNTVFKIGRDFIGADQQALRLANHWPDMNRLKAQMMFDAGQYHKVLALLNELDQNEGFEDFKVECYYRMGSSYLKLDMIEEAEESISYILTMPTEKDYYQPNGALKLGLYYEKQGKKEKALEYFHKALEYEGYPYEAGISQKAKAGINRLK